MNNNNVLTRRKESRTTWDWLCDAQTQIERAAQFCGAAATAVQADCAASVVLGIVDQAALAVRRGLTALEFNDHADPLFDTANELAAAYFEFHGALSVARAAIATGLEVPDRQTDFPVSCLLRVLAGRAGDDCDKGLSAQVELALRECGHYERRHGRLPESTRILDEPDTHSAR